MTVFLTVSDILVDGAIAGEPTVIVRYGRKEVILVSFEEWERVSNAPGFADLRPAIGR